MPRGRKKNYHARGRHFTNPDELKAAEQKEEREKAWNRQRGLPSEDEDEDEAAGGSKGGSSKEDAAPVGANRAQGAPGELPPSDSESESESDEDEDKEMKPKGIQHLIQIENPNHMKQKSKKISSFNEEEGTQLTRKDREEIEKQQAKERYMKAHLAGKTDEARADMARLALIRKNREEAARKRDEERLAQEAKKKEAEDKLLKKKKADEGK